VTREQQYTVVASVHVRLQSSQPGQMGESEKYRPLRQDRGYKLIETCSPENSNQVSLLLITSRFAQIAVSTTCSENCAIARRVRSPRLQQLIRSTSTVTVTSSGKQFDDCFANEAAQAHNGFAAEQDV